MVVKRFSAGLAFLCMMFGAAHAQTPDARPTAVLLDGLGVYVQNDYVGVASLGRLMRQQGYRTVLDNHFMRNVGGEEPVVIVGHSMGGMSALKLARSLVEAGHPAPLVITIDAAPAPPPCFAARCINIFSPGFPQVAGAQNIPAWDSGAYMVNHAMLASDPAVERMVLQYTGALLAERAAAERPDKPVPVPVPSPRRVSRGG